VKLIQALPKTSITQGYGASEALKLARLSPEDHAAVLRDPHNEVSLRRLQTAGKCLSDIRVVDDDDKPVPRDIIGRLQVYPDPTHTFTEYYRNPEATAAKFTSDGWLILGDMGWLDEDGYLHVEGRDSETIVLLSGDNVYPNEIESVLAELPGVVEVAVTKVVAGEAAISEVGAFVRVQEGVSLTVDDVLQKCHKRLGQTWSHPTHIFIQTEKLPRNKNGKCLKAALSEEAKHRLAAGCGGEHRSTLADQSGMICETHRKIDA